MTVFRRLLIASLSVAFVASGVVRAASTTNFSDQWWVANESGWGASIHQQSNTLVVNLLVYGTDGKPTWFVAAASPQAGVPSGHTVFAGDLYATTGPYYGGVFEPASVNSHKVGTLTFDASSATAATMSYSVDGTPVVKNISRATWGNENLTGSYYAWWSSHSSRYATTHRVTGGFGEPLDMKIVHSPDNIVAMECWNAEDPFYGGFYFGGVYSQSGHTGQITGQVLAPDKGSYTFTEIETTSSGFTARFEGVINGCVMTNGQIAAMRR